MKKSFVSFLAMLFIVTSVVAQKKLPDNFYVKKLNNGLEILVIEDNTVPLATAEIVVRNGAYTETPEFDGLSHLYEHMFFKANKDIPSQEAFMNRVNELGISFNGTTSDERVNYFITLSKTKLQEGLVFMNSAIRYPLFLEEEMKKENPVVDGEFQRAESNPVFFLRVDWLRHMWGDAYSRKNTIGDHDIILTATPEKMKIIQEKYYYPNNTLIAVAGDVNHMEVFAMVDKIFGDWKPSAFDPFVKWPVPEFKPLDKTSYFVTTNENAKVPVIMVGFHGPDTRRDVRNTFVADIFSTMCNQKSSKLQKDLVDSGLAFQVNVGYQTNKFTGPIVVTLVPKPDKVNEAFAKLQEHFSMWSQPDYFTKDQLETAVTQLTIDDAYGKEMTSQFVHLVTYWWAVADIFYYTEYVKNISSVTLEEATKYAQKYVTGQPSVNGILLSPAMKEKIKLDKFSVN